MIIETTPIGKRRSRLLQPAFFSDMSRFAARGRYVASRSQPSPQRPTVLAVLAGALLRTHRERIDGAADFASCIGDWLAYLSFTLSHQVHLSQASLLTPRPRERRQFLLVASQPLPPYPGGCASCSRRLIVHNQSTANHKAKRMPHTVRRMVTPANSS